MPWAELPLTAGWRLDGPGADGLPARVPGTVAGAFRAAGLPCPDDLDEHAWTFSRAFAAPQGGPVLLRLDGLATLAEVVLNDTVVLESTSMWAEHAVEVTALLAPENTLELRFAPLGPALRAPRRPRARWRTRLVAGGLRWQRTMLLGRAPGIASEPAAVGPWRPVGLEVRSGSGVARLALRGRLEGAEGVLTVDAEVMGAARAEVVLAGPSGTVAARLGPDGRAELRVPDVARWWPHTHGDPVLHDVHVAADGEVLARRRVGFRTLGGPRDVERDGLQLHVNGVAVFARGAVWSPLDLVGMAPTTAELRATLAAARGAGMNMLRVVGTAAYEAPAFHDLCDELGLLVWQDVMCANLDYPLADPGFAAVMEAELAALVARLAGRPSTAVLCGGSEVGQQAAMLGLDPALAREGVGYGLLPAALAAGDCDAVIVPDAPSGGARPFRTDAGVANYFGVGGYRRGFDDVRRAGVRFASECLALSNLPEEDEIAGLGPGAGVPRDAGSDWDFAEVRDHYLRLLFATDRDALREDPDRYRELSRAVSGEVMAEVFGEWRRAGSPCGGGLVLWLRDLVPGAGWGVLSHGGLPKVAWHHLRRALAPVAVWTTDEGLNGIAVHVVNDGPQPLAATLRVTLHAPDGRVVATGSAPLELAPHGVAERDAEAVLGRFADAAYAYRFGPPAHDVVVATLERDGALLSQAFRFPVGRPLAPRRAEELGVRVALVPGDAHRVVVESRALLYGVRLHVPGWCADDDAFHIAPGARREIALTPLGPDVQQPSGELRALNLEGRLAIGVSSGDP